MISRRKTIEAAAGVLAAAALPAAEVARADGPPTPERLTASTRILEVNGKPARVFGLAGPDGKPGIRLAPDERFAVDLVNNTGVPTIVHWHGQVPPWQQDGFPWPQTPPIPSGQTHAYDYAPIPGTYWMHSHLGLQEQRLLTAPLIVHTAAELHEDRQEVVLMLHDFSFRAPDELFAELTGMNPAAVHGMVRETENVPAPATNASPEPRARGMGMMGGMMGMMGQPGREPGDTMGQSGGMTQGVPPGMRGSGMGMMNPNEIAYDAFLANDRTLTDPDVVRVSSAGRLRLRIINGAAASHFWIDLGRLRGRLVAVDGHDVHPVAGRIFPLAIAQRLDILLDLPGAGAFPILARLEASRRQTGIVLASPGAAVGKIPGVGPHATPPLNNLLERSLSATEPLAPRKPDLIHRIVLSGGMMRFAWSLNGQFWPHITPLMLERGQRVEIELVNHSMMPHPMHLHGHAFQVLAVNGKQINGAVRDTILVTPMMGSARIAFDADNPGRWPFHCHNLYHMMAGMMTEFRYRGIAV